MRQNVRKRVRARGTDSKISALARKVRAVESKLTAEIATLRTELRVSETALAAERLRSLNEEQAVHGVARLRADLAALRAKGVVDDAGRRLEAAPPAVEHDGAADVV